MAEQIKLAHWRLAVKPPSLIKIVLPVLVGMSMGYARVQEVDGLLLVFILLFAVLVQVTIVLLNDYADREADALHGEFFPELIDPRVIPLGLIGPGSLLRAGGGAALGVVATGTLLYVLYDRTYAPCLALASLLIFWMYSFPPVKLNYRGGGELLEMVGVGGVLPLAGYYFYTGEIHSYQVYLVLPLISYALVSALASGLKHEPADRHTGKRTCAVLWGTTAVRWMILALQVATAGACVFYFSQGWYGFPMLFFGAVVPLPLALIAFDKRADYRDLAELGAYKKALTRSGYSVNLGFLLHFFG